MLDRHAAARHARRDATAEQALALGGHVLMAPVDTPAGRSAVITDPQGGVIAVNAPVG